MRCSCRFRLLRAKPMSVRGTLLRSEHSLTPPMPQERVRTPRLRRARVARVVGVAIPVHRAPLPHPLRRPPLVLLLLPPRHLLLSPRHLPHPSSILPNSSTRPPHRFCGCCLARQCRASERRMRCPTKQPPSCPLRSRLRASPGVRLPCSRPRTWAARTFRSPRLPLPPPPPPPPLPP